MKKVLNQGCSLLNSILTSQEFVVMVTIQIIISAIMIAHEYSQYQRQKQDSHVKNQANHLIK